MNNKKQKTYEIMLKDNSLFTVIADEVLFSDSGVEFYKNNELEACVTYDSLAYFADFSEDKESE